MDNHTIRNDKGEIDIAASANNYVKALSLWITENEKDQSKIEAAVLGLITKNDGKLPKPMLVNMALVELNPSREQFSNSKKRIEAFIKSQSEAGKIVIGRGKGSGVRFADVSENEETPNTETETQETGT